MQPSPIEYIHHILDEISYLLHQKETLNKDTFIRDETLKRAFVRSIEIIGEASKKIPDNIKRQYPDIEWKAVIGMRDKLVHDYFGVDHDLVWDVVINKIPLLQEQISNILNDLREKS